MSRLPSTQPGEVVNASARARVELNHLPSHRLLFTMFDKIEMSRSHFNASIQADATRRAGEMQAKAATASVRYQHEQNKKKEEELRQCIEEFSELDESSLFKKSDKELAVFQASFPPESPQYALALNEWNRRLVARQIQNARYAAYIGVFGAIIGTTIGVLLGWHLGS